MVMKDKLHKNHHKGIYYKSRQFLITSVICALGVAVVAVPTYIVIDNYHTAQITKAEEEKENNGSDVLENNELESYTDAN